MKLTQRFIYYFTGFAIGIILLIFFVSGSGASCEYDYGPNARTLKNIRTKERVHTKNTLQALSGSRLDTAAVSKLLKDGKVLEYNIDTKADSCKIYVIEGFIEKQLLEIRVENCDSIATILEAKEIK